jgi:preprotein translocase subunit YajC
LFVPMIALFYFLLIRPQQQQMKAHKALIAAVKRGDTVVLSNGMIGKVTRVENGRGQRRDRPGRERPRRQDDDRRGAQPHGVAANDTKATPRPDRLASLKRIGEPA